MCKRYPNRSGPALSAMNGKLDPFFNKGYSCQAQRCIYSGFYRPDIRLLIANPLFPRPFVTEGSMVSIIQVKTIYFSFVRDLLSTILPGGQVRPMCNAGQTRYDLPKRSAGAGVPTEVDRNVCWNRPLQFNVPA